MSFLLAGGDPARSFRTDFAHAVDVVTRKRRARPTFKGTCEKCREPFETTRVVMRKGREPRFCSASCASRVRWDGR